MTNIKITQKVLQIQITTKTIDSGEGIEDESVQIEMQEKGVGVPEKSDLRLLYNVLTEYLKEPTN